MVRLLEADGRMLTVNTDKRLAWPFPLMFSMRTNTAVSSASGLERIVPTIEFALKDISLPPTLQIRSMPIAVHVNVATVSPGQSELCLNEDVKVTATFAVLAAWFSRLTLS